MKKSTAWVLLLCTGVPTPALWRQADKSAGARSGSSSQPPFRVVVRPVRQSAPAPRRQPVAPGWLSDDPDVAAVLAHSAPVPVSNPVSHPVAHTPPPLTARRQAAPKTARQPAVPAPAAPAKTPAAPRSRAAKREAERAAWPSSWDSLAAGWDQARG